MTFWPQVRRPVLTAIALLASTSPLAHAQSTPTQADDTLASAFADPPASARPRAWWHWMNGNVTIDGIDKDLAWMKAVGLGGAQTFDVNLQTPQIVADRLVYMTPAWKTAFAHAAATADRLGLELGIAASPGWSETGGPWVPPADGLKKVVWSTTDLAPGKHFVGALAPLPGITGPFQTLAKQPGLDDLVAGGHPPTPPKAHGTITVLAVPVAAVGGAHPTATDGGGAALDAAALAGGNLDLGVKVAKGKDVPSAVVLHYAQPQSVRAAMIFIAHASVMFGGTVVAPVLEASDDGATWHKIADVPAADVPTTVSFAPVTARQFRLVLNPQPPKMANMGEPAPGSVVIDVFGGLLGGANAAWDVRQFTLAADPAVDRFETKAGFALSRDYFAYPAPADAAQGTAPTNVVDLSSKLRTDGTLDWAAPRLPKGQTWRVIQLGWSLLGTTNHPAPAEATGLEVDKFDAAAVRRYIDHYLGLYQDAAGPGMLGAHGVRAIVTDSIEVGAANWTPDLVREFTARRGYDPTPWLPTLAGVLVGSRADSDRFLFDYRRTLADLIASAHYGTVADVAHAHGLTVYGEALEDHRPSLGDDMAMRSHADVPMSAMWTYRGAPNPSYLADTKGAASVAHLYGQNLVAAESMTSALNPWADSPRTLKRVIDQEFLQGINRPVIHTSVHQPTDDKLPGLSLMIFGQYFNRHEAWAPLARPWIDYLARNAVLLQQGHDAADVGYFYGEEAPLTGLYGDTPVADAPRTHAYDFVNADALLKALSNDGSELVSPGGARYRALYLGGSSRMMTLPVLRRLAALVDGGATVIGTAPVASPSQRDAATAAERDEYAALVAKLWPGTPSTTVGKGRVIASADVETALATAGIAPDFSTSDSAAPLDLPFVHRHWQGGDDWFLVNRGADTVRFTGHFRVTGKAAELWHPETGAHEPASYSITGSETAVPLTLAAGEALHIVFRSAAATPTRQIAAPQPQTAATLDGSWQVAFEPGRGAPASAVLPTLVSLDHHPDPAISHFAGVATYTRDFVAPKTWKPGQPLWLNLGEAREVAQVTINGTPVGAVWHAPYRLDVTAAAHSGVNHLEVKVGTLWVNRLIGDAAPGATKVTWTALPTYRADAPLVPAGLIGPVTVETAKP